MKISMSTDISDLERNAPRDLEKTLMIQTVYLLKLMKLLNKCHWPQLSQISNREFSAAMVV